MISDPAFDARITRNGDRGTLAVLARSTEIVRDRPGPHSWGDVEERTLLVRMPDGRVRPHIETAAPEQSWLFDVEPGTEFDVERDAEGLLHPTGPPRPVDAVPFEVATRLVTPDLVAELEAADAPRGVRRGLVHRLRPAPLRVAALAIAVAAIVVLLLPPPDDAGARAFIVTLVVVGLAAAALAVVVLLLLASRSAAVGRTRRGRWGRVAAANARRWPGSAS